MHKGPHNEGCTCWLWRDTQYSATNSQGHHWVHATKYVCEHVVCVLKAGPRRFYKNSVKKNWSVQLSVYAFMQDSCSSGGRAGHLVIGRWLVPIPDSPNCMCVLEQDTEAQIAPYEQLVPCMAASTISVWMGECDKCCKVLWVVSGLGRRYRNVSRFFILLWSMRSHISLYQFSLTLCSWKVNFSHFALKPSS